MRDFLFCFVPFFVAVDAIGVVFSFAGPFERFLGHAGSRILSKIASLFLASIAVMLIRRGVVETLMQVFR